MSTTTSPTPLSDLRDEQAAAFAKWRANNIEYARSRENARNRALDKTTKANATRNGEPWTEEEFVELMADRPLVETALKLGRTYRACLMARRRRKKMLGMDTSNIKTEKDPYNGQTKGTKANIEYVNSNHRD